MMAGSKTTEVVRKIKPFVMRWINETVGGGAGAPSPHDLNSSHHSGSLADSQAPQFLKTDGSRTLTGDLPVSDTITIDGVDVSVFKSAYDTHVAATAHAGHAGGVGVHTHQGNPEGGQLDHGLALTNVTANQHHNQAHGIVGGDHTASGLTVGHVIRATGATTFAWQQLQHGDLGDVSADQHHNQVHGIVSADHTVTGSALDVVGLTGTDTLGVLRPSADPGAASAILKSDASGGLTLQALAVEGTATMHHILPEVTDTYDLGSSTKLWRKGWLSEMDAVLFAENSITLLGGWFYVTKYSGTAQEDIDGTETQIDLGADTSTMSQNDFIVFRQALQVEYMQLGSYVGSNVWNVTRDVDGSGANTWPQGAPFTCLGYDGDGRIELSAYDTPRISLMKQGTSYNTQAEPIRIGDLNGNWGYSSEQWGIAIGEYGASKAHVVFTDDIISFRLYTDERMRINTVGLIRIGDNSGTNTNITISDSQIQMRQGTTATIKLESSGDATFGEVATDQGNMLWNNSNKRLEFRGGTGGTTVEGYVDTTGKMVFSGGDVILSSDGLRLDPTGTNIRVAWRASGHTADYAYVSATEYSSVWLYARGRTGIDGTAGIQATDQNNSSLTTVWCHPTTSDPHVEINQDLRALKGLYVGSDTDPTDDWIELDGAIHFHAEMSTPSAPAANGCKLYLDDSGGKTRLMALFSSGAAQVVATQP